MDFNLTSEQRLLEDSVRRFIDHAYGFEQRAADLPDAQTGGRHWQTFADNGWLACAVPEAYGGLGGTAVETALIAGGLGRGLVVEPYLGCGVLAAHTLLAGASEAQKLDLLPRLVAGQERFAVAYSEAAAPGDPAVVGTTATPTDDGHVLHGRKTLVLGGVGARAFIVSARTPSDEGAPGDAISLFQVDAAAPGVSVRPWPLHDGSHAAELRLDGVRVDRSALLGTPGTGLRALQAGLTQAIAALCAELVGGMDRAIEITADYLRVRQQFGVALASFQALQHRMADMAAEAELARSMLYALLHAMENDPPETVALVTSQAKALVCRSARYVCGQAIQLHGGIGMTKECEVGHHFKRAVVADLLFGGGDLHEEICAARLQQG